MQQSFLSPLHWQQRREIYQTYHNIPRQIQLTFEAVTLMWFFNLGSRLILLTQINKLFRKDFWQNDLSVLLFFATTVSIIIPSLFIQSHSVFNSVQFLWIALVVLCIPTGIIWGKFFQKNIFTKCITVFFIGIFSVIGYWYVQTMFFLRNDSFTIKPYEIQLYKYFADIVPPNSFIIFLPEVKLSGKGKEIIYHKQPIIAAMTGRKVYYESEITPYVDPAILEQRQKKLEELFWATERCNEKEILTLLQKIGSHYVMTDKKNTCLGSPKLKGVKIEAQGINLYNIDTN
jgi:hypothetical protein